MCRIFWELLDGYIAGAFNAGTACIGGEPFVDSAFRAVGSGILQDGGIEFVAQRVALVGDRLVGRGHAIHGQQPQTGLGVHLVDVVVDRETDGIGRVVILCNAVHQLTHGGGGPARWGASISGPPWILWSIILFIVL